MCSLYNRVDLFSLQNNSKYNHYNLNPCQQKWVHPLGKVVNINIHHVNCQYVVWPPSLSRTSFTPLGMEFTRALQVATGVLFHFSMTTSLADIWDLAHLHLPLEDSPNMFYWVQIRTHAWPALPSATSVKQWSSWRCVWSHCHAGTVLCYPVSGRRGSCSAAVFHRSSCFPQWNITLQHLQHLMQPYINCIQTTFHCVKVSFCQCCPMKRYT